MNENSNIQYPSVAPDGPSQPGIQGFSGSGVNSHDQGTTGLSGSNSMKKVRHKPTNFTPKKKKRK